MNIEPTECHFLQSGKRWQHGRNIIEMSGHRFGLLRNCFRVLYIDLQAAYVISDVGVLDDDLGTFAGPQTFPWINGREVVVKGNFGINVAFGNFRISV